VYTPQCVLFPVIMENTGLKARATAGAMQRKRENCEWVGLEEVNCLRKKRQPGLGKWGKGRRITGVQNFEEGGGETTRPVKTVTFNGREARKGKTKGGRKNLSRPGSGSSRRTKKENKET